MQKKIVLILILLIAGLLLFGCVQTKNDDKKTDNKTTTDLTKTTTKETDVEKETNLSNEEQALKELEEAVSREKMYKEMKQPNREKYCVETNALGLVEKNGKYCINSLVFKNLPEVPEDFGEITYLFENKRFKDLEYFTKDYYLQPEFYENSFNRIGTKYWYYPDTSHWGTNGYGAYPAAIGYTTKPGQDFKVTTFWHAGYGIQTYQGFKVIPIYPKTTKLPDFNIEESQDPIEAAKCFETSFENDTFVLGPTYPLFSESAGKDVQDWARKLVLNVKVKSDCKPGIYIIASQVIQVPEPQASAWQMKYLTLYNPAISGIAPTEPHFRAIITVNK